MRRRKGQISAIFWVSCFLIIWLPRETAAAPLHSNGYTIIDLGLGQSMVTNAGSGSTLISASGGTVYPFPETGRDPSNTVQALSSFPLPNPAPVWSPETYGNPNYAWSYMPSSGMNANGLGWVTNEWGVTGHSYETAVYAAQYNGNGQWSNPVLLWMGTGGFAGLGDHPVVQSFNASGLFLGTGVSYAYPYPYISNDTTVLYNLNTKVLTDLSFVTSLSPPDWKPPTGFSIPYFSNLQPIAIDDAGRILLSVQESDGTHDLLLVPDGVSANPLSVPEPGTWLAFSLALAWIARRNKTVHKLKSRYNSMMPMG